MANNILLFNAAFSGYLAGALAGGNLTDNVQADYLNIVSQASTFAVVMDAAIPTDAVGTPQPPTSINISLVGGAADAVVAPTFSGITESQSSKPQLMEALCFGAAFERFATGQSGTVFTVLVAAIKAAYFQTILSNVTTPLPP